MPPFLLRYTYGWCDFCCAFDIYFRFRLPVEYFYYFFLIIFISLSISRHRYLVTYERTASHARSGGLRFRFQLGYRADFLTIPFNYFTCSIFRLPAPSIFPVISFSRDEQISGLRELRSGFSALLNTHAAITLQPPLIASRTHIMPLIRLGCISYISHFLYCLLCLRYIAAHFLRRWIRYWWASRSRHLYSHCFHDCTVTRRNFHTPSAPGRQPCLRLHFHFSANCALSLRFFQLLWLIITKQRWIRRHTIDALFISARHVSAET